MKRVVSLFLILSFFSPLLFAEESIFLMPRDADRAVKTLANDLEHAQKSIRIAIYSFTHKMLAKSLKKAAKRGVKITIIFDEASNRPGGYSRLPDLAKIRSVTTYTLSGLPNRKKGYLGKMHMKLAIIDGKRIYFGSANWSYSAFSRSYELLYRSDSPDIIREADSYFSEMLQAANLYD